MKLKILTILACVSVLPLAALAGAREETFLRTKMVPLARAFVKRNALPPADFATNHIKKCRVHFFDDGRPGCTAYLGFKEGYWFDYMSDGTNSEVRHFVDDRTRTYYNLAGAPPAEIRAVKDLNLGNKLNTKTALALATMFFKMQGHRESDFHPPEIHQCYWVGDKDGEGGPLPYYRVDWYRKDVTQRDRDSGIAALPEVTIQVSGVTSNLISYSKLFMPVGRDF